MILKSNGRSRILGIVFTLLTLGIACSQSFGQISESDTTICETIEDYRGDNLMISDLINTVEECDELQDIKDDIISSMGKEIKQRINVDSLQTGMIADLTAKNKTLKRGVLVSVFVIALETLLLLR